MNDEIVAKLEAERLTGMPRWHLKPEPKTDWQKLLHTVTKAVAERPTKREPGKATAGDVQGT